MNDMEQPTVEDVTDADVHDTTLDLVEFSASIPAIGGVITIGARRIRIKKVRLYGELEK